MRVKPSTCPTSMFADGMTMLVQLEPALHLTNNQFYEFCRLNRELRIERTAGGGLSIMSPAGWDSSRKNAEIIVQLGNWTKRNGTGVMADSSAGFMLPNGAIRSPDASWISNARLQGLSRRQRTKFLPLCPQFVVELRSPTDSMSMLQAKMEEYMANGAELGWLIDSLNRQAFVYRPDAQAECLEAPDSLSAGPLLPGFQLRMADIW